MLDPWWPGCILKTQAHDIIAIKIAGAAHHLDLRGSDPADPPAVRQARLQERDIINRWLNVVIHEKSQQAATTEQRIAMQ